MGTGQPSSNEEQQQPDKKLFVIWCKALHLFAMKCRDSPWKVGVAGVFGERSVGRKFSFQQPQHAALGSPLPSCPPCACSPGRHLSFAMQPPAAGNGTGRCSRPCCASPGGHIAFHPPKPTDGLFFWCACSETSGSPLKPGRFAWGRRAGLTPSIGAAKPSSRWAETKNRGRWTLKRSRCLQSRDQSRRGRSIGPMGLGSSLGDLRSA